MNNLLKYALSSTLLMGVAFAERHVFQEKSYPGFVEQRERATPVDMENVSRYLGGKNSTVIALDVPERK